jgi:hypothetical protein
VGWWWAAALEGGEPFPRKASAVVGGMHALSACVFCSFFFSAGQADDGRARANAEIPGDSSSRDQVIECRASTGERRRGREVTSSVTSRYHRRRTLPPSTTDEGEFVIGVAIVAFCRPPRLTTEGGFAPPVRPIRPPRPSALSVRPHIVAAAVR